MPPPVEPIRVAYIATSAGNWGGASRYLYNTLKLLDRNKVEPYVLFPTDGPVPAELDQAAIGWTVWPETEFHRNPVGWSYAVARTAALLKKQRIELLHVNHVGYWRPAEIIAARLLRIPVITHLHRVLSRPQPFVKYSALTIANSAFTARASLSTGEAREVVYCSVLPELLTENRPRGPLRDELGIGAGDTLVSFVGQVRRNKGIAMFIEVARALAGPKVHFAIAGECRDPKKYPGSYTEAELRHAITDLPTVHYLGYRKDIAQIYRDSDLLLVPSQWDEPFGLINIEAGAAGLAVIATRVGGIPECIDDGRTGFLVDRNDSATMVRHTRDLIGNRHHRQEMGQAAKQRVADRFTTAPVRRLEEIYRQLLAR